MKPLKISLRLWITLTSIFSFLGGWALLSHAGKPVPLIQTQVADPASVVSNQVEIPTLAPIPSIGDFVSNNSNFQSIPVVPSAPSQSFMPRLRTRGS